MKWIWSIIVAKVLGFDVIFKKWLIWFLTYFWWVPILLLIVVVIDWVWIRKGKGKMRGKKKDR